MNRPKETRDIGPCSKCEGELEGGFMLDKSAGGKLVGLWARGTARKSEWTGTRVKEEDLVPVGAYRCTQCGFLELFARYDFAAR